MHPQSPLAILLLTSVTHACSAAAACDKVTARAVAFATASQHAGDKHGRQTHTHAFRHLLTAMTCFFLRNNMQAAIVASSQERAGAMLSREEGRG